MSAAKLLEIEAFAYVVTKVFPDSWLTYVEVKRGFYQFGLGTDYRTLRKYLGYKPKEWVGKQFGGYAETLKWVQGILEELGYVEVNTQNHTYRFKYPQHREAKLIKNLDKLRNAELKEWIQNWIKEHPLI